MFTTEGNLDLKPMTTYTASDIFWVLKAFNANPRTIVSIYNSDF